NLVFHVSDNVRYPRNARAAPGQRRRRLALAKPLAGAAQQRDPDPPRHARIPLAGAACQAHRPPQEERLMGDTATKTDFAFSPAITDDAAFAADVDTAVRPSSPRDPMVYQYWWSHPDENWVINRFIVSRGGRRVGHASSEHARWEVQPERYGTVGGELLPMERTQT